MDGTRDLPDFYIPNLNRWFEIKGKPLNADEIKKCEEFCQRLANENIKYSALIGLPNLCVVHVGEFFGILEYVWEWPYEKYPDNCRLQAPKLVPSERSFVAVEKSVDLYIVGRSKAFDLLPRMNNGKNWCVLWQKYVLINSRERSQKSDINPEQSSHVECVVLISRVEK